MNRRTRSGKALITAAAVIGALAVLVGGGVVLKGFVEDQIFMARFMMISKEQQDNNRKFFENVGKLGETTGATKESLAMAYASLLRTRIDDIKSGIDKARTLRSRSAKTAAVKDGLVEMLHETVKLNEKAESAALKGDFDEVVRIEAENEKQMKPMAEAYFAKLKAAGIPVPNVDKTVEKAVQDVKDLRDKSS